MQSVIAAFMNTHRYTDKCNFRNLIDFEDQFPHKNQKVNFEKVPYCILPIYDTEYLVGVHFISEE